LDRKGLDRVADRECPSVRQHNGHAEFAGRNSRQGGNVARNAAPAKVWLDFMPDLLKKSTQILPIQSGHALSARQRP
jgi:hypothetical protein